MTINERVKFLRKEELKLTQQDFADKLDLGRATIGNIEIGKINLTDRNIKAICETFDVSEQWLRTGEGEVFVSLTDDDEITDYMTDLLNEEDSFDRKMVLLLRKLSPEQKKMLESFIVDLCKVFGDK